MSDKSRALWPVKLHYFFFFAALGPILPQINVYGKQLGISPDVMGYVTAVLPLLWAVAKPCFGYLVDYFSNKRKLIFMLLIAVMSGSYCCLWLLPHYDKFTMVTHRRLNKTLYVQSRMTVEMRPFRCSQGERTYDMSFSDSGVINSVYINDLITNETCNELNMKFDRYDVTLNEIVCSPNGVKFCCDSYVTRTEVLKEKPKAIVNGTRNENELVNIDDIVTNVNKTTKIPLNRTELRSDSIAVANESLVNIENFTNNVFDFSQANDSELNGTNIKTDFINDKLMNGNEVNDLLPRNESHLNDERRKRSLTNNGTITSERGVNGNNCSIDGDNYFIVIDEQVVMDESTFSLYTSFVFWGFVLFSCVGTVAFNVANCISDAICFDVLGETRSSSYGVQRAFGTAGYGLSALVSGWLVDRYSSIPGWKNFMPAFVMMAAFTVVDIISCSYLNLPKINSGMDSAALKQILSTRRVQIFLLFAVIAGMFDSFIIYYMFWYIEELATSTEAVATIKLLEGVIVAAQSFAGELLFFFLSGHIIKRLGHGTSLTLCLFCYAVRMTAVSLVTNPWFLVPIEALMQGPTYALCYATIVSYAAVVAPPGYSATVQGIVAGMDDGLGFALGSLLGGILYKSLGGCWSFRVMASIALVASGAHALMHGTLLTPDAQQKDFGGIEMSQDGEEAKKMLPYRHLQQPDAVYNETTEPIFNKSH